MTAPSSEGYGHRHGSPCLHLLPFFHLPFFPCPMPFHSSPLFCGLIHSFPGAFYHCHFFSPLALDPQQRNESVNWRGAGRELEWQMAVWQGQARAYPSLLWAQHLQQGRRSEGWAGTGNCWQRGCIFHCWWGEEGQGWGCANATVKDEFITDSPFFFCINSSSFDRRWNTPKCQGAGKPKAETFPQAKLLGNSQGVLRSLMFFSLSPLSLKSKGQKTPPLLSPRDSVLVVVLQQGSSALQL